MKNLAVKLDTTRVDNYLVEARKEFQKIDFFITSRKRKLEAAIPEIEKFAKSIGADEMEIGNMYSTHNGDNEYSEIASMIVHSELILSVSPKNEIIFEKKVISNFMNIVSQVHQTVTIGLSGIKITGSRLSLHFFIS